MLFRCVISHLLGNDAPAIGSRKRRRKGGASVLSAAPSTSDDLEPGVEWYEDDTCDAADCKRPKKKRTPWVFSRFLFCEIIISARKIWNM